MANTRRRVPGDLAGRYEPGTVERIERGLLPLPLAQRHGDGLSQWEVWSAAGKRMAKREVARARRRAGKAETRGDEP